MSPQSDAAENAPALDLEKTLEALGDDMELVTELAEILLDDIPRLVEEVERSIAEGDSDGLRHSAHTLKGAASNFNAAATVSAALRLEVMGRDGDLSGAEEALSQLLKETSRLKPELEKLMQG